MKNTWSALLLTVTACARSVAAHEPTYAPPTQTDTSVAAYADTDYDQLGYGGATYGETTTSRRPISVPRPAVSTPVAVVTPAAPRGYAPLIAFLRSIRETHYLETVLLRFADGSSPRSWMAAHADGGGFFVAAARRTPTKRNEYSAVANVIRLDAAGVVQWTTDVGEPGFATFEVPDVLATLDGGAIAHVQAYKHPARNGFQRFVKVDTKGRREWAVQLPGGVDTDAPHVNFMLPGVDGSVELSGYWVRRSELVDQHDWSGHMRMWRGRLDRTGRLTESSVGDVMPESGLAPWPLTNPVGDAVTAP